MKRQIALALLLIVSMFPSGCANRSQAPPSNRAAPERRSLKSESSRSVVRVGLLPLESLPAASIAAPKPHEVIEADVYDGMSGVVAGQLPEGTQLWVFARDRYNCYLQYPPPTLNRKLGEWRQGNIRLTAPEAVSKWELVLCLATAEASRQMHASARRGEWSFPSLPEGVEALGRVAVERRKNR